MEEKWRDERMWGKRVAPKRLGDSVDANAHYTASVSGMSDVA